LFTSPQYCRYTTLYNAEVVVCSYTTTNSVNSSACVGSEKHRNYK